GVSSQPDPGVYLSTDTGKSWSAVLNSGVSALFVSGTNIFADGYISTNNGTTWMADTVGLGYDTFYTRNILSYALSGGNLFAGTNGGVFLSTDNGTSWTAATKGLPYNIIALAVSGTNIFALADTGYYEGGIYLSTDNGTSWTSVTAGLEHMPVNAIAVSGMNLFAGTDGYGVWRRPLSDFGISSVSQSSTSTHPEIHSYPNPFSQSTQITFTPESAGYADISVVNLLGEQVARVFSGELDAGPHNFTFSSTAGLPDGMYECLVRMNRRVEKVGMVLLH
ncbi:MAG: hypothetical protein ACHQNE_04855, partial [Candidatus Kapaibacterium sp.]